jgi:hypothetical protein
LEIKVQQSETFVSVCCKIVSIFVAKHIQEHGEERAESEKNSMPDMRQTDQCEHTALGWYSPILPAVPQLQAGERGGDKKYTIESLETF